MNQRLFKSRFSCAVSLSITTSLILLSGCKGSSPLAGFSLTSKIASSTTPTPTPTPPLEFGIVVPETLIGFNAGMMFADQANFKRAFAEPEGLALQTAMGPKILRFPGGTVANCYHPLKRGIIYGGTNSPMPSSVDELPGYGFIPDVTFTELKRLKFTLANPLASAADKAAAITTLKAFKEPDVCSNDVMSGLYNQQNNSPAPPNIIHDMIAHLKRTGSKSIIYVPNILSGTRDEYRYVMKLFKDNGITVLGIEIGNELYFGEYREVLSTHGCKDITNYIEYARSIAGFFKAFYPEVKVSVIAPGNFEDPNMTSSGTSLDAQWRKGLAIETTANPQLYDAYSIHGYFKIPSQACMTTSATPSPLTGTALATCAYNLISNYKNNIVGDMKKLFTTNTTNDPDFKPFDPRLEAWITEWNLNAGSDSPVKPLVNTMFHGCVDSEFLIGMIQNSDWVTNSDIHSYSSVGGVNGVVFNNKAGDKNLNNGLSVATAPTYYSMKFANQAVKNGGMVLVAPDSTKAITTDFTSNAPVSISSVVVKGADNVKRVLYANCSGKELKLSMSNHESISKADTLNALNFADPTTGLKIEYGTTAVVVSSSVIETSKKIPPYSIGVLELK